MNLNNKIALITGASKGIGRAISIKFAENGCDIIFFYKSNEKLANKVAKEVKAIGRKVLPIKLDVSNYIEVERAKLKIRKNFEHINILVNNAGILRDSLFEKMSQEQWDDVININLTGVFNCTRVFLEELIKSEEASIVNITSISGIYGNVGQTNYSASKSGIIGFTKALAKEVAGNSIRVNAIAPGFIETDIWNQLPEHIFQRVLKKIPLRKIGNPDHIANTALFLASKDAKYITGQVIKVDGGIGLSVL
ncbi:3-oxoacyl-[acyl-carrier-protein] reductase [Maledivibacter halophilus]|uniref:3-oxoacyl-[acyl-carrier-protein] reductase n=1 Tax=Maledivibacter halophilus TaxID=36842 RepID=A0A1T5LLN2_9FIRM|nr:3-oxoacyl-[acyl-carrier-protein] reductase [Maledivibacter halophilus]SKC76438.1 3-oxoacyl-[acyl-carrier-protein] reductase [Maledivibacter halophilus]